MSHDLASGPWDYVIISLCVILMLLAVRRRSPEFKIGRDMALMIALAAISLVELAIQPDVESGGRLAFALTRLGIGFVSIFYGRLVRWAWREMRESHRKGKDRGERRE
jgi:hypothetical protein